MKIITDRLLITEFDESMAETVHVNSLDDNNRRFVPDEVFETIQEARNTILFLIDCYKGSSGPFVHPVLLRSGENIGYVQAVPLHGEWEVGYHIAKKYTRKGYATEALMAFIPIIMNQLGINRIWGICHRDNIASRKVLEKCSFSLELGGIGDSRGQNHEECSYIFRLYDGDGAQVWN
ncbi:GNAT family N-acetyltransferase [Spirochaeta dissipatitropha]